MRIVRGIVSQPISPVVAAFGLDVDAKIPTTVGLSLLGLATRYAGSRPPMEDARRTADELLVRCLPVQGVPIQDSVGLRHHIQSVLASRARCPPAAESLR
jgi:hypothetical protein